MFLAIIVALPLSGAFFVWFSGSVWVGAVSCFRVVFHFIFG